jgi:3-deoxy-manno-octulosonate cytidylyltransferase (CMP-KDO synthetase)
VDGWDIGTVAAPLGSLGAWRDTAVVKVVRREDGGALYFSRAPVPFAREGEPAPDDLASERYLRHIGVYAFTPAALQRWVALPAHWLEGLERLEQLRPLAAGMGIGVALAEAEAGGVDTLEDLRNGEARIVERREFFISRDA